MRELNSREVGLVSGGIAPALVVIGWAGVGGTVSGGTYWFQSALTGSFTTAGAVGSVVTGAVGGGFAALGRGLTGAAAVVNAVHSGVLGGLSGGAAAGMVNGMTSPGSGTGTGSGSDKR